MYQVFPRAGDSGAPAGYSPAQIQQAYQFPQAGNGANVTIAIVDAYDDPNIQSDLQAFDGQFGLPAPPKFTVVNETGGSALPGPDTSGGWEVEESLDVEWAHAMAPGANILLVEANSAYSTDLLPAVTYAMQHADVVSISWGGREYSGELSDDSYFTQAGVAVVVASGDSGAPAEWPSTSPDVLGVGGTQLTLTSGGAYSGETGWGDSTGGPSAYEPEPSYQKGVAISTTARSTPDVAYDASSQSGFAVYDSYLNPGWIGVGGTSAGAPQWAAILAIADQGRVAAGLSTLSTSGAQPLQSILYKNPGDFHDITSGTSTGRPRYSAGPGYDYVTGLGTPMVNQVVDSFGGTITASPDTLLVTSASTATAGGSFSFTVTAELPNNGGTDTGFTGTVSFTSTDSKIQGLPSSSTFTAADGGSLTFNVVFETAGSQTITATSASGSVTSDPITVSPAAASTFVISGLATATVGTPQSFTVTAEDPYGNVATGYTGTVMFTGTDGGTGGEATLPGDTAFTAANAGTQTLSVTFGTPGTWSLTVTDTADARVTGTQSGIGVSPAAPTGLAATTASSSPQIDLTWSGSAGATGYEIERSLNPPSGWAVVSTTTATTYSDTGLTAGTTYYYQVIATGGGYASAASNTASATTTGTAPPPPSGTESIWGTSYSPTVNTTHQGLAGQTFELGVQFESNVDGWVTGVLFYKQRGTSGTNAGHLWSSNGTLLASATFSHETRSGWQEVNFSNPVPILANTIYIISYNTGSSLFYYDKGYFNSGVTNGDLTAPADGTTINGQVLHNGVYNYGGYFPGASQDQANFWVDVAFAPSASSSASAKTSAVAAPTSGPAAKATGPSGYAITAAASATPAGLIGVVPRSQGTSSSTARQPSVSLAVINYRLVVTQARAPVLWGQKATSFLG